MLGDRHYFSNRTKIECGRPSSLSSLLHPPHTVSSELRCPLRAIVSVAARLLCGCRLLILPEPIARMHLKPERTTCSAVQQHASALQLQPLQQR